MRLFQTRAILSATAILILLAGRSAQAQSKYTLTDLGAPSGGVSAALGINASGHVVGSTTTSGSVQHAFRWDPTTPNATTGASTDIHPAAADSSLAGGINATGMVVGWYSMSGNSHPFRTAAMTAVNTATDDLGGGTLFGAASGINDSGGVVGQINNRAYRTSGPTIVMATDAIGPASGSSNGAFISNTGVTAGTVPGGVFQHAAEAAAGGLLADIVPGGPVGAQMAADSYCVNSSAVVAGAFTVDSSDSFGTLYHAFRTNAGANLNPLLDDLGTLGDTNSMSWAYGVNSSGLTVGVSQIVGGAMHGFRAGGAGMEDLNGLLDASGSGWVITAAYAINDAGQIVGTGIDPVSGKSHAILLSVPAGTPPPFQVNSISPKAVLVGSSTFTLTVFGSGFTADSKVKWKTTKLNTTFVNPGQLTAVVPASLIAHLGNATVMVEKPGPIDTNFIRIKIIPYIFSVQVKPNQIIGGSGATGRVYFYFPSPTGGATVNLGTDTPSAAAPTNPTLFIPQTFQTGDFPINTTPVAVDTTANISGTYSNSTRAGAMVVQAPQVTTVTFNPPSVKGGSANSTGTVTLQGPAPAGGFVITLTSMNTALVTVPPSITVLAGSTTGTFTATSHPNAATKTTVTVKASHNGIKPISGKLIVTH